MPINPIRIITPAEIDSSGCGATYMIEWIQSSYDAGVQPTASGSTSSTGHYTQVLCSDIYRKQHKFNKYIYKGGMG